MARGLLNRVYAGRHASQPIEAETVFGGSELLKSNHYAIVPTDPATRRPYGAFSTFQPKYSAEHRANFCACLCVSPPAYGCGALYDSVERMRVAALVVDVRHRKAAEEIASVIALRHSWPTAARVQPTRVSADGSALYVYQLPERVERYMGPRSLGYTLPGDPPYAEPHSVYVQCVGDFFTVSGPHADRPEVAYEWRPGLEAAHHDALPLLPDIAAASALVNACESVLRRHGKLL